MKLDTVYNKSCQRMDELPDGSVDVALTSSPYWGLRDYGDDVREIWDGDSNCQHKFDALLRGHHPGQVPQTKKQVASGSKDSGQFCSLCNAWYGQLGLEPTFQLYLDHLAAVCAEIKRVLKKTGSFFLNMGDTYGGNNSRRSSGGRAGFGNQRDGVFERGYTKCLLGIPWRLALRLVDEQGWILRNAIIWNKPNAMPSSVKDRCSNGYEFLFHLVKQKKYYYDLDAIREPVKQSSIARVSQRNIENQFQKGKVADFQNKEMNIKRILLYGLNPAGRNPADVWTIPTQPRPEAHFATFPDTLCLKPILATCPQEICRKCGKARVRIIKVGEPIPTGHGGSKKWTKVVEKYRGKKSTRTSCFATGAIMEKQTIGWTDCGCNAGFEPGIVLDPFAGRGTALIMAKKLSRHYIGYELKKEYCEKLIEPALRDIDPLFS